MRRWSFAVVFAFVLAGCGTDEEACRTDGDCPAGYHCVDGTGVCARMTATDASVPDLEGELDGGNPD